MSLRIVPAASHPTSTTNTSTQTRTSTSLDRGAPSAPGLPDTLRLSQATASSNSPSAQQAISSTHPLETRLKQWTSTQDTLKSTLLARTYGIAEPLRRDMELGIVRNADGFVPSVLTRGSSVSDDILCGRDTEISWEDVYPGRDGLVGGMGGDGQGVQVLEEMEGKLRMGSW